MMAQVLLQAGIVALGLFYSAQAQIKILAPTGLKTLYTDSRGRVEGSTATFGAPYYGQRVLGRLVWGEPKNSSHCTEKDYDIPLDVDDHDTQSQFSNKKLINIVMVRRGLCSFVRKVYVAQEHKGAHAVIIVDKEGSLLTTEDIQNIIMADDGYGELVHIPSILISSYDGSKLIEWAKKDKPVVVELQWEVPTDHIVVVDLWMSSASLEDQKFLKEFSVKRMKFKHHLKFVPHYAVFGMTSGHDFSELCTDANGEFCAEDPDSSGPITGRDVLEEDVRQLCIHELTSVKRRPHDFADFQNRVAYAEKFWEYVSKFGEQCPLDGPSADGRFGLQCSKKVMRLPKVDIQPEDVLDCVKQTTTTKLKFEKENTAWSPRAMRINGWRYMGMLDAELVTRAICAGYVTPPDVCKELVTPRDPLVPFHTNPSSQGMTKKSFFVALTIVGLLTLGAMFIYKQYLTKNIHKQLREEVMIEVQAQMDTYKLMPN